MGIGGGAANDTEPRSAPAAHRGDPAIAPGMPGRNWWKAPVYETPEWWKQNGWPVPTRIGVIVTTTVALAALLLWVATRVDPVGEAPREILAIDPTASDDQELMEMFEGSETIQLKQIDPPPDP